jgi:Type I restriction enzyme R protein N terminus (HSDR_N)
MAHARSFDTMNETDVRETIVRPLIERLGYRHGTDANIITEKTLRYEKAFLGRKSPKKDPPLVGRADYICEVVSFGRWVVEVKAPAESVSHDAVEQAHTYASHPEIAATFFLVTNGRTFQLYETSKLLEPALAWEYEDEDDNWLRLFNLLNPDAFRRRARLTLVDPGMPLGIGLASRLRIIGGTVTYEEHKGDHPFLQAESLNGMALPVVGGYVTRGDDRRIIGHLKMAKVAGGPFDFNKMLGVSDEYDFYTAADYISVDAERPSIFQNFVSYVFPFGTHMTLPGLGNISVPMEIASTATTEAVGYVHDDRFVGVMQLELSFTFTKVALQTRMALASRFGDIPEVARITGSGRFEIELQSGL